MVGRQRLAVVMPLLLVTAVFMGGCVSSGCEFAQGQTSGGQGQGGACNQEDSFSYGFQGQKAGDTMTWNWENTQEQAEIRWGFQGQGGYTIVVEDAAGDRVFTREIGGQAQEAGSDSSSTGEPGTWRIQVSFSGFQGQMGIQAQAA